MTTKCTTPDGIEIFNPLEYGIHGKPLMVPAHEYNRTLSLLNEAVSYLREGKAKFAPETTNSHVDVFLARYDAKESNARVDRAGAGDAGQAQKPIVAGSESNDLMGGA